MRSVKDIGLVTVARSDYGILKPVIEKIVASEQLQLRLYVTGMHLATKYGETIEQIIDDEYEIFERVHSLIDSDSPTGIGKSIGLGTTGFAQSFNDYQPDILIILGDRFEFLSPALAALPHNIPIGHIHGGELTEGLIDDYVRHTLTKLSYFHFTSAKEYKDRVIQLGEEPSRVFVTGAPGLDTIRQTPIESKTSLSQKYQFNFDEAYLLITYHPVTLRTEDSESSVDTLLDVLSRTSFNLLFSLPNADTKNQSITSKIRDFTSAQPNAKLVDNFGSRDYFSVMKYAKAMVGNSSSGLIEAPSFALPVVNIGERQDGRVRGENVIDVPANEVAIKNGIEKATSESFKNKIQGMGNPYGDGYAASRIIEVLEDWSLSKFDPKKKFYDIDK